MVDMLETRYDPKETEKRIYELWEKSGYFNPDNCVKDGIAKKDAEVFSMVLPPPNVTGELHMGHAAMLVIEDILARLHRMRGDRTLWVPGTDHAAIATQSKVEKIISKEEKKTRHDLGREEFLRRVNDYAGKSHDFIVTQIKRMGASLDWSREAYTLDEERVEAVSVAFKELYDKGLIYRGNRVVNWDPKGQTVISDDEILYEERKAMLYTFRYEKDFPIAISTTRPETKLGDTAVAVHPKDKRYEEYVGKEYDVNFCGVPLHIKVIADESVEKDFGTGALGVTPAHSAIDWELAERHSLPHVQVINEYARITVDPFKDKKTTEAREMIVEELRKNGLMEKEEEVPQNVSTAERTGGIIEPLPKLQWFIAVNKEFKDPNGNTKTLKQLMREAVQSGQTKIIPERFEKIYFHWIDNLRDWCISRQIWFGHQIPVWYRGEEVRVGTPPKDAGWEQDSDTLDTWFSSGLWPFSTLGWPHKTDDLKTYFPNSVLETGYDILFFWIARMILMSTALTGEVPFRKVYLHGLVRDEKGRKMSKSLGNGIDPLLMADKYGADATRLSLVIGASAGNDLKLSEDRIRGYRNFGTKIWNAARFVLMNKPETIIENPSLSEMDQKNLKEFGVAKAEIATHLDSFEFHLAAEKAYHYFWHTFADKIIEEAKPRLKSENNEEKNAAYATIEKILIDSLKLLHPFMPFVTEAIFQEMKKDKLLMVEAW